ncbi:hypothetical protein LEP1GSC036_2758 [Leptospira weilii str. 2006001853]|uniref:Uncharacterized protein n=1 Tax=Leptospira weilii str. 2006001853 TaxID=1001589 RepID=A0A828Z2P5_9LEPT|nr:hypothetical protein LEP1GSC036_2758 [Leptospira weilii str. 2006001853]
MKELQFPSSLLRNAVVCKNHGVFILGRRIKKSVLFRKLGRKRKRFQKNNK